MRENNPDTPPGNNPWTRTTALIVLVLVAMALLNEFALIVVAHVEPRSATALSLLIVVVVANCVGRPGSIGLRLVNAVVALFGTGSK